MTETIVELVAYSIEMASIYNCLPNMVSSFTNVVPKHPQRMPTTRGTSIKWGVRIHNQMAPESESRRSANYQPAIWNHDFIRSLKIYRSDDESKDRVKKLEEEVKSIFDDEDVEPDVLLELIDKVQRLGLGYYFKQDITRAIYRIVSSNGSNETTCKNLHAVALRFRILRQHGHEVSQDVFKCFKDDDNDKFQACLYDDTKGMLSLYEASYLAVEGERLLYEARAFTTAHLSTIKPNNIVEEEEVSHTLDLPLHHRMLRHEARWFTKAYNKREDVNNTLIELATMEFNTVQSALQRDLQDLSRWWMEIGLANKLSFVRDRLMESFFWAVGMVFEPQFSGSRKSVAKAAALVTVIDDVYDVYGSLEELKLFTDAVERWNVEAIENLPDYMKLCFLALYNTVNQLAYDTLKEQGVNTISCLRKTWTDLCKAFLQEAKWCYINKKSPPIKDYLDNGWVSSSGVVLLVHAYCSMNQHVTKEAIECLDIHYGLLQQPSMIFRLCNDLASSTAELERGEITNSIACYMNETGLSEEFARKHVMDLIDESWKKINKDQATTNSPNYYPKPFMDIIVNLARTAHCTYQYGDGHGVPDNVSKKRIESLLLQPIISLP